MKTNTIQLITFLSVLVSNFTFGQLEQYIDYVNPYLSEDSIQGSYFYFD